MKNHDNGFAIVEGILILVIVGLIGLVGYKVYNTRSYVNKQSQAPVTATPVSSNKLPTAPAVNSTKDLNSAEQSLSRLNTDDSSSDLSQLDSQVSGL
jgi:hypothetical protein